MRTRLFTTLISMFFTHVMHSKNWIMISCPTVMHITRKSVYGDGRDCHI